MSDQTSGARHIAGLLLAALDEGRFVDAAALVLPAAAQSFRDQQLENHRRSEWLAKGPPLEWGMTPEQAADYLPKIPNPFLRTIWRVADCAAFEALSPTTVLARFFAFRFAKPTDGGPGRAPGSLLGAVSEGSDLVHVILRGSKSWRDSPDWEPIAALTMKRTSDGWAALLNGELVYGSDGGWSIGLSGEGFLNTDANPDAG